MKHLLILLSLIVSFSTQAAVKYQFEPTLGKVEFKTKGWPNLITIKGEGTGVTGTLMEDGKKVSGDLVFNLDTLKTGISLRDDHMKNKYLQVEKHPEAKLSLSQVEVPENLNGEFDFMGELELHGTKKSVKGQAELEEEDGQLVIKGSIPIKLSEFNIDTPSYKGITVAENVNINFESKVKKQ